MVVVVDFIFIQFNKFKRVNTSQDYNFDIQLAIFEQFCCKMIFEIDLYQCEELKMEQFKDENTREKYSSLWNDFVSIKVNLFDGKLKHLFKNILNIDENKINQFYNYFSHYRTLCAILPVNADCGVGSNMPMSYMNGVNSSINEWFEMTEKIAIKREAEETAELENSGSVRSNLDDIFRFNVLWNGIFSILHKKIAVEVVGLVTRLKNYDGDKIFKRILSIIRDYIFVEMVHTNIFGRAIRIDHDGEENPSHEEKLEIRANNKKASDLCKAQLFDGDINQVKQLIAYCTKENISNIESYTNDITCIVPFIVNELSYVVFHDLTIDLLNNNDKKDNSNSNSNNNSSNSKALFPKLLKFFKFLYNLSCYIYCYPFQDEKESFYVSYYFDLRNTL